MPAHPMRMRGWLLWITLALLAFCLVTFLGLHYKLL
jgi:hypothetical protein